MTKALFQLLAHRARRRRGRRRGRGGAGTGARADAGGGRGGQQWRSLRRLAIVCRTRSRTVRRRLGCRNSPLSLLRHRVVIVDLIVVVQLAPPVGRQRTDRSRAAIQSGGIRRLWRHQVSNGTFKSVQMRVADVQTFHILGIQNDRRQLRYELIHRSWVLLLLLRRRHCRRLLHDVILSC